MRILGIESSCDETAVSIIEVLGSGKKLRVKILSNVVSSQMKLHTSFGGVVPNLARREHQENFVPVLMMALKEAKLPISKSESRISKQSQNSKLKALQHILAREPELLARMIPGVASLEIPDIDAIAVTIGPGLAPALWVGVNFARSLSYLWKKPLIPVNHLEGHIVTNFLGRVGDERIESREKRTARRDSIPYSLSPILFPALCLIVSGGHTELVLIKHYGSYQILGETLDDAAGEAFDKVARMMNLGFPGGPVISKLAESGNPKRFSFPRPMMYSHSGVQNFDFSFSGLKTSVLYTLRDFKKLDTKTKRDVSASFQAAVVDVLVSKTIRASKQYRVKTVMIGGGVAANKKLRHDLGFALDREVPSAKYLIPSVSLTGDNALMIALAGYFNRKNKKAWSSVQARANLRLDDR